ncbi:MAG: non-canonical purine NTP pyrophosphatase, partial [Gammaproteobacteria bacterium]|nr:non-canonical purine NTP pyrophosphatase [Gammaproteobacteria bacterium]
MSADNRIVVATGNPGKLNEIMELLDDTDIEFVSQQELGVTEAEETGMTFVE